MQGNRDVDALMLAGAALLALLVAVAVAQRRATRRAADAEAEAEARARARRRTVPIVSSNLRGQLARPPGTDRDLWAETAAHPPREVPPLGIARPDP
jgi:regulator of protease activity HflC (stomatin/prohibitin superfamily)